MPLLIPIEVREAEHAKLLAAGKVTAAQKYATRVRAALKLRGQPVPEWASAGVRGPSTTKPPEPPRHPASAGERALTALRGLPLATVLPPGLVAWRRVGGSRCVAVAASGEVTLTFGARSERKSAVFPSLEEAAAAVEEPAGIHWRKASPDTTGPSRARLWAAGA